MFPLITAGPQEIHFGTRILGSQQVQQQVLGISGTRVPIRKQPLLKQPTHSHLMDRKSRRKPKHSKKDITFNKTCTSKLVLFHRIMDIKYYLYYVAIYVLVCKVIFLRVIVKFLSLNIL
jgi:hypothetical protein